ncbi:DUF2993 domain-containing protein [Nocardia panacis]|uniref:DUF2993 domain-containing protein n=1 Tax=Nocardia panacis TaxID=2340916 RepID=A0A3A4KHI5_9NOCA|nr:DUF2993 domain-containing protein [Nocardia panacis]RJO73738.1 DUF2993 domain-containing protein [Nocardia panacis]
MRTLVLLIGVLGIGLIAGDRGGVVLVQNEVGRQIAAGYSLPDRPHVEIRGVPFLTQAIDGTYRDIDIRVGDWSGQQISVHDLDVALTGVSAPLTDMVQGRTSNIVAQTATATALVPFDTIQHFAPPEVESISNGPDGLRVSGTFPVEGVPVAGTVVVTVAPTDNGIEVTPVSVRTAGDGPTIPLALLRRNLTFTVPLQRLPLGAQLTAIQSAATGLRVTAVAHTVRLSDMS